jgi:hypothetical protein
VNRVLGESANALDGMRIAIGIVKDFSDVDLDWVPTWLASFTQPAPDQDSPARLGRRFRTRDP